MMSMHRNFNISTIIDKPRTMPDNLDVSMTENDILRQLIVEENDAVISYTERAGQVNDPKVRRVLLDIAEEEKVHAGELSALLSESDPEQDSSMIEGAEEVEDLEAEVEKAWQAFKSGNQTSVEDKLDVLLAQNQEIQVDTARTADLVPAVLGDKAEADYEAEEVESGEEVEGEQDAYSFLDDMGDDMGSDEEDVGGDGMVSEDDYESDGGSDVEYEETEEESDVSYEGEEPEDGGSDVEYEETAVAYDGDSSDSDVSYEEESEDVSEGDSDESEDESDDGAEGESDDEDEDEDDDESEGMRKSVRMERQIPERKTIKSLGSPMVKRVVGNVQKPSVSATVGHTTREAMAKAIVGEAEPVMLGQGITPDDVTAKDMEFIQAYSQLRDIL